MSQLTKDEMRKSLKKIRQSITGEKKKDYLKHDNINDLLKKKDYDLEITCRFLMTEEYNKADTVLCYAGTKDEIDTRYLIYAALANHKRVGLPRCNGDILDFYYVRGLDDLMVGSFGIMEPDVRKCSRILDFRNSVLVVPGLGFSPDGKRIGYGRGYYDRFISHYNGKVVGMCYHQQVKMNIPVEETDENINVLITEQYTRNI